MISPTLPLNTTKVHSGVGPGVGWTAGVSAFLASLNPEFVPVPTALGQIDPPVHSDASVWLQGTELAARVVSAYASLPGGSCAIVTSVLNFCIVTQTLWRLTGRNKEQEQKATPGQQLDNRPPSMPKTAIALGAMASLAVADAASDSTDSDWIEIADTPRPIGRGFLDRSKNFPASTRLPWIVVFKPLSPFQSLHRLTPPVRRF